MALAEIRVLFISFSFSINYICNIMIEALIVLLISGAYAQYPDQASIDSSSASDEQVDYLESFEDGFKNLA